MSGTLVDGFTRLNDITSIYRPDQSEKVTAATGPCLIVYCSWMGAATKHIAKYIEKYKQLFPDASILLIESTLTDMFTGSDLAPACNVINSFAKSSDGQDPYIVLHAYSNGGANNATWLADRLLQTTERLPFSKLILDCCPGKGEATSVTQAITMSLPKQPLIRVIGSWLIYSTCVVMMSIYIALGWEDTISRIRRRFNDANMFSTEMPKLYLYSENDALVNWEHVHEHAEDAKQKGYLVREEKFTKAAHVALLIEDNDRYWNAVKDHILGANEK